MNVKNKPKLKQISKSNKTQISTIIQQICPLHEHSCQNLTPHTASLYIMRPAKIIT